MKNPLDWAGDQFRSLGRTDARELSRQLMAAYEGSTHTLMSWS